MQALDFPPPHGGESDYTIPYPYQLGLSPWVMPLLTLLLVVGGYFLLTEGGHFIVWVSFSLVAVLLAALIGLYATAFVHNRSGVRMITCTPGALVCPKHPWSGEMQEIAYHSITAVHQKQVYGQKFVIITHSQGVVEILTNGLKPSTAEQLYNALITRVIL
jgi:hypothetical protein